MRRGGRHGAHPPSVLCVIGTACLDRNLAVACVPGAGDAVAASSLSVSAGGRAANTAAQAALLGVATRLICRLGDDPAADVIRASAQAAGLHLHTQPAQATSESIVLVDADGERTLLYVAAPDGPHPRPDQHTADAVRGARLCWVDVKDTAARGAYHAQAAAAIRGLPSSHLAREAGSGRRWELVVGSVDDGPPPTAGMLEDCGARACVITRGAAGASVWQPQRGWTQRAARPAQPVVDTCGAGDAYLGGLLGALHDGRDLHHALAQAERCGAQAVSRHGAWPAHTNSAPAVR